MSALPANVTAGAELYLCTLTKDAPTGALLDVRYRTSARGMARLFIDARASDAASIITRIGAQTDVYVGCALRTRRRGTRHDLAPTALLWADCDTPEATAALQAIEPRPTMIVASGSKGHAHAYWTLTRPLAIEPLQAANRALAKTLGADERCADPARILRPPDTLNFKQAPPSPVELIEYTGETHDPATLLAVIREAAPSPPVPAPRSQAPCMTAATAGVPTTAPREQRATLPL
jgi:RepB DNA-primase N-terminal domain